MGLLWQSDIQAVHVDHSRDGAEFAIALPDSEQSTQNLRSQKKNNVSKDKHQGKIVVRCRRHSRRRDRLSALSDPEIEETARAILACLGKMSATLVDGVGGEGVTGS